MYLLTLLYHFYAFYMHLLCLLWYVVDNENRATVSPYSGDISYLGFAERLTSTLLIIIICHFFTCMIILLFKITLNHYSKKLFQGCEKTVLFSVEKLKEGKIFLIIFLD